MKPSWIKASLHYDARRNRVLKRIFYFSFYNWCCCPKTFVVQRRLLFKISVVLQNFTMLDMSGWPPEKSIQKLHPQIWQCDSIDFVYKWRTLLTKTGSLSQYIQTKFSISLEFLSESSFFSHLASLSWGSLEDDRVDSLLGVVLYSRLKKSLGTRKGWV